MPLTHTVYMREEEESDTHHAHGCLKRVLGVLPFRLRAEEMVKKGMFEKRMRHESDSPVNYEEKSSI